MSLINFAKAKSKFTFDKTFITTLAKKTKEDVSSFQNFICLLSDELKQLKNLVTQIQKKKTSSQKT